MILALLFIFGLPLLVTIAVWHQSAPKPPPPRKKETENDEAPR